MEKLTLAFLGLLIVLFFGHIIRVEAFGDASGNNTGGIVRDNSGSIVQTGSYINLSISDLLALIGSAYAPAHAPAHAYPTNPHNYPMYNAIEQQQQNQLNSMYYGGLMNTPSVTNYIPAGTVVGQPINMATPPSHADAHGQAFVKYKYGINPADYIRKDSIPCYACTLPA